MVGGNHMKTHEETEISPARAASQRARLLRLRKQITASDKRAQALADELQEARQEIARLTQRLMGAEAELDQMTQVAYGLHTELDLDALRARSQALSKREGKLSLQGRVEAPRPAEPALEPQPQPAPAPPPPTAALADVEYDPIKVDGDPYDVRPDDCVWPEIRAGEAFLEKYRLLSDAPDFAGAIADLNDGTHSEAIVAPDQQEPVDVSIVLPVYGQLAYTLNCLDSLRRHASARRFEVIVYDDCSVEPATVKHLPEIRWIRAARAPVNKGFIHSCNDGAALARGAYYVMLNNDTRVLEGWLDEMIGAFDLFPNAGLVGSKLLYPDGTLQEAGGIVWRDGSAWNYGRNDDPNRPEYCYARRVDYISGASIALPADLWRALGGFDGDTYERAYYEDNDMAFRVREVGKEVWLQPLSRVIHYEGKTSGTNEAAGEKAYQAKNRERFLKRWKETLTAHRENADNPWRESQRTSPKVALLVDTVTPTPDKDSGSVDLVNLFIMLQRSGYQCVFAPEDNMLFFGNYTRDLQRRGVMCLYYPYSLPLDHFLSSYGSQLDLIISHRFATTNKWFDKLKTAAPAARFIYNTVDLHFLRERRQAEISGCAELLDKAAQTELSELSLIERSDAAIVVSSEEHRLLVERSVKTRIVHLPLIRDIPGRVNGPERRSGLLFLGGFRHEPNVDAVRYFLSEIWPKVREAAPDAIFRVAGSAMPDDIRREVLNAGAEPVGFVHDLAPIMESSLLTVAPLRYGAGAKGKVISSLAHGVPVIGSPIAAEGMMIDETNGVFVCHTPQEYVARIAALQTSPSDWDSASLGGMAFAHRHHSIDAGLKIIEQSLKL